MEQFVLFCFSTFHMQSGRLCTPKPHKHCYVVQLHPSDTLSLGVSLSKPILLILDPGVCI